MDCYEPALDCIQRTVDAKTVQDLWVSTETLADVLLQVAGADTTPLVTACMNALAKQLNNLDCSDMASQAVNATLKSLETLNEFSEQQEIPVEKVREALTDVKSYLPKEAADVMDLEIKTKEHPSGRIPWRTVMEIITFIICVLSFVKEFLPDDQLGKIIELLSQDTEIVEESADASKAFDNQVFEIAIQNQVQKNSQRNQENGNIGNQPTTL